MRRLLLALLLAVTAAPVQAQCRLDGSMTVLTVAGAVSRPNRGASAENVDQMFKFADIAFAKARAFDGAALARLPQHTVQAVLPYGPEPHAMSGPLLSSVLEAAGAAGRDVKLIGLDRFEVELTAAEIAKLNPVLALCRDGKRLGLGGLGPAMLVSATPNLPDKDWMAWGVFVVVVK